MYSLGIIDKNIKANDFEYTIQIVKREFPHVCANIEMLKSI